MKSTEQGLTVGELSIAVGALIIATLAFTAVNKKEGSNNNSNQSIHFPHSGSVYESKLTGSHKAYYL